MQEAGIADYDISPLDRVGSAGPDAAADYREARGLAPADQFHRGRQENAAAVRHGPARRRRGGDDSAAQARHRALGRVRETRQDPGAMTLPALAVSLMANRTEQ